MAPKALRERGGHGWPAICPKVIGIRLLRSWGWALVPGLAKDILKGAVKGRKIVNPNLSNMAEI